MLKSIYIKIMDIYFVIVESIISLPIIHNGVSLCKIWVVIYHFSLIIFILINSIVVAVNSDQFSFF